MKKKVLLVVIVVLLVLAVPVSAKQQERVGDPINVLFQFPGTFAAGEPFHIAHGFGGLQLRGLQPGKVSFELYVDEVFVDQDYVDRNVYKVDGEPLVDMVFVHNFPDGMQGEVTFEGFWYLPCTYAVDVGFYFGTCDKPNDSVEVLQQSHTVTFTP